MDLYDRLEKAWARQGRYRETYRTLTFTENGLELGNGSVVAKLARDDRERPILAIDGNEERILALISVAWDQPMPDGIIEHFHRASRAFSKGDLSLAYICLAQTGLQPLEQDEDSLRQLFLADGFLKAGISGNELRKEWGLGRSNAFLHSRGHIPRRLRKDNDNHYPAGTPDSKGGEFAPKDGTSGKYGENVQKSYIRQKVAEALQGKKAIALVGGAMDGTVDGPILGMLEKFKQENPGVEVKYFTNDGKPLDPNDTEDLSTWLSKQGKTFGSDNIAVVGHSWGGDTAAKAVANGNKVGALITLDPVSDFPPNLGDVKSNANTWINVNANPTPEKEAEPGLHGNFWANNFGKWGNDPKDIADHHYNANINHADIRSFLHN